MNKRKIIIGLGNPSSEYKYTRHNAGLLLISYLLDESVSFNESKLQNSTVYKYRSGLVLAKLKTFMNDSGLAIKEIVKWYDADIENDLIIAHDDLDIPLGMCKYQFGKSPREHNGVLSAEQHLGTTHFFRIRIGIENRINRKIPGKKYVLDKFTEDELVTLREVFSEILEKHILHLDAV
ncbi:MAG: aminoacyl-tRNA hydrolase [Patescibacteria group bacterium]|nr:aminoacyl-tRNA hydrolase [Patescibacteria group bacterium]